MKRIILIISFLVIMGTMFFGFKFELIKFKSASTINSAKAVSNNHTMMSLKGLELITDENFKVQMIEILDSIIKYDYQRIYYNLSKKLLEKHYPEVTNVDEYVKIRKEQRNPDGTRLIRFLEVTDFKILSKKRYQVDYIVLWVSEGTEYEDDHRYDFIYEDNRWKIIY